MQTRKTPIIRPAKKEEIDLFLDFCFKINFIDDFCKENIYVLEVPNGSYIELYKINYNIKKFIEKYLNNVIYSTGLYLGILDIQKNRFKPSLPLAHELSRFCDQKLHCCILDDYGEKMFLYGRIVHSRNLLRTPKTPGYCLVVNSNREALGWGILLVKPKNGRKRTKLKPVIDLGWYLRRGG